MLILIIPVKRVLNFLVLLLTSLLLAACSATAPLPIATVTPAPSLTPFIPSSTPTTIPSPTIILTVTPELGTPRDCMVVSDAGKVDVLNDEVFFAYGPSGEELDQALANHYPEWGSYKQDVSWSSEPVTVGKIVREASFQEEFALNSAVTLITLGESLNWQIPSNDDLFSQSLTIAERLARLWDEYSHPDHESIRATYPEVINGATYALYVFFDYDTARLEAWCNSYQRLFEASPLNR